MQSARLQQCNRPCYASLDTVMIPANLSDDRVSPPSMCQSPPRASIKHPNALLVHEAQTLLSRWFYPFAGQDTCT
jgi:hypothetical protein